MWDASVASGRVRAIRRNSFAVIGAIVSLGPPAPPLYLAAASPPQLHFRHDEPERRPSAGGDRSLEPLARLRRIAAHQIPIADPIAQRCNLDVAGIGGRKHRIGRDLATVEPKPLRVCVARGRYVQMTIQ